VNGVTMADIVPVIESDMSSLILGCCICPLSLGRYYTLGGVESEITSVGNRNRLICIYTSL
jgi:hypothetical protein